MSILAIYASEYGATRGIAEWIVQRLTESGQHAEAPHDQSSRRRPRLQRLRDRERGVHGLMDEGGR